VNSPLADPEILERLFGSTLDEVFRRVRALPGTHPFAPVPTQEAIWGTCACGRNPLLAYFPSCEEAVLCLLGEAVGLTDEASQTAVAEVQAIIRSIASREVATFCSLCRYGTSAAASANGEGGTLEFFPMTREMADSWLDRVDVNPQLPFRAERPKIGRCGPEE